MSDNQPEENEELRELMDAVCLVADWVRNIDTRERRENGVAMRAPVRTMGGIFAGLFARRLLRAARCDNRAGHCMLCGRKGET